MLITLTKQDIDKAGAVLGRAFADDPVWVAAFSDPEQRPDHL